MRMALNLCMWEQRALNIRRSVHVLMICTGPVHIILGRDTLGIVCYAYRHFVNRVHKIAFLGRVIPICPKHGHVPIVGVNRWLRHVPCCGSSGRAGAGKWGDRMNGEKRKWSQIVITYPGWGGRRKFATLLQELIVEDSSDCVGNDMQWTTGGRELVDRKETGCGK